MDQCIDMGLSAHPICLWLNIKIILLFLLKKQHEWPNGNICLECGSVVFKSCILVVTLPYARCYQVRVWTDLPIVSML